MKSWFCLLALLLLTVTAAFAQSFTATLSGTVTDPSGAIIPNAKVTITNPKTGVARTVTTDANGNWSFATPLHFPSAGTTTCTVSEIQQPDWLQTGNTVDQSLSSGGAAVALNNFVYTVTLPNDKPSSVDQLFFGNVCRFR